MLRRCRRPECRIGRSKPIMPPRDQRGGEKMCCVSRSPFSVRGVDGLWFGLPRSFADRPTWSGYVGCKSIISWRLSWRGGVGVRSDPNVVDVNFRHGRLAEQARAALQVRHVVDGFDGPLVGLFFAARPHFSAQHRFAVFACWRRISSCTIYLPARGTEWFWKIAGPLAAARSEFAIAGCCPSGPACSAGRSVPCRANRALGFPRSRD